MGPLFVLFIWLVTAGVVAVIGGWALSRLVRILTRGVQPDERRMRAIRIAEFIPACGFAYLFLCLGLFSIWSTARGRDMGWGDSWDTPILGGYHLTMVDVTEQGSIRLADRDVVSGVRRLEVRPPYIFGTASPQAVTEEPIVSPETLFFVLDTRTGTRADAASLDALQNAALKSGEPLRLESVEAVYGHYRYQRAELIVLVIFAIPPFIAAWFFFRLLIRVRSARPPRNMDAARKYSV